MRIAAIIAFVALVHVGSAPLAAQQRPNAPPKASPFGNGNLFAPPSKPASPPRFLFPTPMFKQSPGARLASKPAVVCGLTLIPGDPDVDPAIRREVPADGPRFAIRSVDPKLCRQP